jgi:hypothetical protein
MGLPKTMPASPEDARLIALGRKVETLLASEDVPEDLVDACDGRGGAQAWAWFRDQLLEPPVEAKGEPESPREEVIDLMQALKDSLKRQGEAEEDANGR